MNTIILIVLALAMLYIVVLHIWRRERTKTVRKQDQDIKKLHTEIREKDLFITELIKKYGLEPKDKQTFRQRLEAMNKKKNLKS